jgi:hypothetical protein
MKRDRQCLAVSSFFPQVGFKCDSRVFGDAVHKSGKFSIVAFMKVKGYGLGPRAFAQV